MKYPKVIFCVLLTIGVAGLILGISQQSQIAVMLTEAKQLAARTSNLKELQISTDNLEKRINRMQARLENVAPQSSPEGVQSKTIEDRVFILKNKLQSMPKLNIPELEFATERNWKAAAWDADLETDEGIRDALSSLRHSVREDFLNTIMRPALKSYLAAHDNVLPENLFELRPYFPVSVSDEVLVRYELISRGKVGSNRSDQSKSVIRTRAEAIVDPEHDSNQEISLFGGGGSRFNVPQSIVESAAIAFIQQNGGRIPTEAEQVTPWINHPLERATIQKYLNLLVETPGKLDQVLEGSILSKILNAFVAANPGKNPTSADLLPYAKSPEEKRLVEKIITFTE